MKSWEFSMTSAMRTAMRQNRFDTLNLYLKLEKASKKYLENGEMKEGDSFKIPLENGAFLEQFFYKDYSTLNLIRPTKEITTVISKESSIKQEYEYLLGYTDALEDSGMGIGARFPEFFRTALKEVKPGQVLVFDNGRSYVCTENDQFQLKLVRTSETIKIPHISEFQNSESHDVSLTSDISIQNFYTKLRDDYNDDVRFRMTTTYNAQEMLNKLTAGLDKQARVLQIGPNRITVKKKFLSKGLSFYNEKNEKISEESVKIALAWLKAAPVVTEFVRKDKPSPHQEFDDNMLRANLDKLFANKEFDLAGHLIGNYCEQNKQDLSINFSSYVNGNATSFSFRCEEDGVKLYRITYEDNDFTSEPTKIERVSFKEFKDFCTKKYDDTFIRIENDIKNELLKKYPQYHGKFLDKVISDLAEKKIEQEKLISPEITITRCDISNLIESMETNDAERE